VRYQLAGRCARIRVITAHSGEWMVVARDESAAVVCWNVVSAGRSTALLLTAVLSVCLSVCHTSWTTVGVARGCKKCRCTPGRKRTIFWEGVEFRGGAVCTHNVTYLRGWQLKRSSGYQTTVEKERIDEGSHRHFLFLISSLDHASQYSENPRHAYMDYTYTVQDTHLHHAIERCF